MYDFSTHNFSIFAVKQKIKRKGQEKKQLNLAVLITHLPSSFALNDFKKEVKK